MSNTEDQRAREETALDAMVAAAFMEESAEADDNAIDRYRNALTDEERKRLDEAGKGLVDSLFAGETKKPKERAPGSLSTAMNRGDDGVGLTDEATEEMEQKISEARQRRRPPAPTKPIHEHDVVRVRSDLQVENYSLRKGMVGTVVGVYREGAAFAVEFPKLERGSAVVTLYRDQVELVEETHE